MSVDERLRGALRDQADEFVPQVEDALDRVRARGRRERWRGSVVAVAAAAAVVAIVGAVLAVVDQPSQQDPPVTRPTVSASGTGGPTPQAPLRGAITTEVDRPDVLAGRWTLQLNGNGSIDVSPPEDFGGEVSGPLFTADTTSFRTSLFQDDLCRGAGTGIYSWLRVADQIEFQALSDTCRARARFFADSTWTLSTGSAVGD